MITENYVSFEIAKLLKDKGFSEWCSKCYGVAVLHNGADISFDEECELKDEGKKNEIEYIEGGRLYNYGYNNRDKDTMIWAAPTLWVAMKWLREVHDLHIIAYPWKADREERATHWCCQVYKSFNLLGYEKYTNETLKSYEEACEAAIKYCLENLI